MFDVIKYKEIMESLTKLREETDNLKEEVRIMIYYKNKEIGQIINNYFSNYYNKTERYQKYGIGGFYREHLNIIEYKIEIGDELVDQLKNQYGRIINKNFKRSIELNIQYDIIKDGFTTIFWFDGFYGGLISDENIKNSIYELLLVCKGEFDSQDIKIEEIEERFSKVKYYLDNYEAFVIANKLIQY